MPHPPTAISFDPGSTRNLLIVLPNNTIKIFDIEEKLFPDRARTFCQSVSQRLASLNDPAMGLDFHPSSTSSWFNPSIELNGDATVASNTRTVMLWGASWVCKFRIGENIKPVNFSRKRRRDEAGSEEKEPEAVPSDLVGEQADDVEGDEELGLIVWTKYKNLMGVGFLNARELVVVERPLLDVLAGQPPAYYKSKYGT